MTEGVETYGAMTRWDSQRLEVLTLTVITESKGKDQHWSKVFFVSPRLSSSLVQCFLTSENDSETLAPLTSLA